MMIATMTRIAMAALSAIELAFPDLKNETARACSGPFSLLVGLKTGRIYAGRKSSRRCGCALASWLSALALNPCRHACAPMLGGVKPNSHRNPSVEASMVTRSLLKGSV